METFDHLTESIINKTINDIESCLATFNQVCLNLTAMGLIVKLKQVFHELQEIRINYVLFNNTRSDRSNSDDGDVDAGDSNIHIYKMPIQKTSQKKSKYLQYYYHAKSVRDNFK